MATLLSLKQMCFSKALAADEAGDPEAFIVWAAAWCLCRADDLGPLAHQIKYRVYAVRRDINELRRAIFG